jgi:type VI secretion system protein ImpH
MADAAGPASSDLNAGPWLEALAREPGAFDFHVALRRIEATFCRAPRLGEALRPSEEPVRIGQAPSLSFEPTAVTDFSAGEGGSAPFRLFVEFLGMWGPQGPLPLHLTEYARDRARQAGDRTLASFMDVFHHRMLLLFHRAWARTQPAAMLDRPDVDRFAAYVGSIIGLGFSGTRNRDAFPDRAKLFYAGQLASSARNAEGLRQVVSDYFGLPTKIEEFVGDWLTLSRDSRWHLGAPDSSQLGRTTIAGARVWSYSDRFRIVLGPLTRSDFDRLLPGSEGMAELTALVRLYTNDEWGWDVRLTLGPTEVEAMRLAGATRLGWTSRIGRGALDDLVLDPMARRTRRVRPNEGR